MAALLILGAYGLLSFGKILPSSWVYQAMNIVGAAGFIINCAYNNAWPSVALNIVWMELRFTRCAETLAFVRKGKRTQGPTETGP